LPPRQDRVGKLVLLGEVARREDSGPVGGHPWPWPEAQVAPQGARKPTVRLRGALRCTLAFATLAPSACSKRSGDATVVEGDASISNQVPPLANLSDLNQRAGNLFEAVAKDDPSLGESFWFPKPPFLDLKDPPNPGAYWEKLHRAYENDIHAIHGLRHDWDDASFDRFELGSDPRWINPGDEHNRIGYYRSLGGRIVYRVGQQEASFVVDVIITWQGRWYVTHLRRVRK
jgi:hypothetical protein